MLETDIVEVDGEKMTLAQLRESFLVGIEGLLTPEEEAAYRLKIGSASFEELVKETEESFMPE